MSLGIDNAYKRIRQRREALGLSQDELAERVGYTNRSSITKLERGQNDIPLSKLKAIAAALQMAPMDLIDDSELLDSGSLSAVITEQEAAHLRHLRRLDTDGRAAVDAVMNVEYKRCTRHADTNAVAPLPTRPIRFVPLPVSAGTGVALTDEPSEAIDIPLTDVSRQADFVLRVSGDSMEPRYHNGDLLLIQQTDAVDAGDLGVFAVNGEGFFKRAGKGQLESLNPEYVPIRLQDSDSVTTFGRVLGTTEIVNGE